MCLNENKWPKQPHALGAYGRRILHIYDMRAPLFALWLEYSQERCATYSVLYVHSINVNYISDMTYSFRNGPKDNRSSRHLAALTVCIAVGASNGTQLVKRAMTNGPRWHQCYRRQIDKNDGRTYDPVVRSAECESKFKMFPFRK